MGRHVRECNAQHGSRVVCICVWTHSETRKKQVTQTSIRETRQRYGRKMNIISDSGTESSTKTWSAENSRPLADRAAAPSTIPSVISVVIRHRSSNLFCYHARQQKCSTETWGRRKDERCDALALRIQLSRVRYRYRLNCSFETSYGESEKVERYVTSAACRTGCERGIHVAGHCPTKNDTYTDVSAAAQYSTVQG